MVAVLSCREELLLEDEPRPNLTKTIKTTFEIMSYNTLVEQKTI